MNAQADFLDNTDDPASLAGDDPAADAAALAAIGLEKWPKMLVEMLDAVRAALLRAGADAETAERHARHALLSLSELWGGENAYIPRGDKIKRALRDDQIYRDMGRVEVEEIARRYRLTIQQVYAVNRVQLALRRAKMQPGLF